MRAASGRWFAEEDECVDLEATLADVPLFAGLDRRTVEQVAKRGKHRSYEAGEAIITQDAPASALYVILTGHATVEREHGQLSGMVGELGPGDFFGELALIEEHPRTATVRATEPTECVLFVAWEFTALLKEHPQIAVPIMNALIARIHRREHHLE
jgi:CRP/FNR family cyclic AMP-dependent transcriptional regulator